MALVCAGVEGMNSLSASNPSLSVGSASESDERVTDRPRD